MPVPESRSALVTMLWLVPPWVTAPPAISVTVLPAPADVPTVRPLVGVGPVPSLVLSVAMVKPLLSV